MGRLSPSFYTILAPLDSSPAMFAARARFLKTKKKESLDSILPTTKLERKYNLIQSSIPRFVSAADRIPSMCTCRVEIDRVLLGELLPRNPFDVKLVACVRD